MARYFPRALVAITALALVLSACGSSGSSKSSPTVAGSKTTDTGPVPQGGSITIGAEQEPDCMDWVGQCAGSAWGSWMAQLATQPQAFRAVPNSEGVFENVPSNVLTGMPKFETTPVQTITYNINPDAVWSDGVPISCADFQYTADEIANGPDIYDPTGYTDIASVTCPTPKTAVVKYKTGKTYAGWTSLFGGGNGILPSHILKGKNRDKLMKDGYAWSGGPWFAKWTRDENITLTPNPKYWGDKAHLDKVVFKFQEDTAAEFQAFKSGQVDAIYPKATSEVIDAVDAGISDANTEFTTKTGSVEALWPQLQRFPFDSKAVRQALGYSIDRIAIVKKLYGALGVDEPANSLNPYVVAAYSDQQAWAGYKLDLDKVDELMTGDGWEKNSSGIWAKDGKTASFTIITTAGNKLRELTEQILQPMLKTAGFDMKIHNKALDDMLQDMSVGNYQLALIAQSLTSITPGLCTVLCTENIPGPKNDNSGNNWSFASVPSADVQMRIVDTSLDDSARRAAAAKADQILADYNVALPLDPTPNILIWNKKIVGPVSDNPAEGMFWNIEKWGLKQ